MQSEQPQHVFNRWFADSVLLATAILWGINIIVFKYALAEIDAWVFNGLRMVFATVTLGVLAWIEARLWPKPRRPINVFYLLGFCLFSGFFYLIIFVKGIALTTAGNTALILASMPMWTAVLSFFCLRERLPRITWIGLLVTFVGTIIVTTQSSGPVSFASDYFVGNLYMLAAAICWALGTVISKPILNSLSPIRLAFISAMVTTPLHVAIALYVAQSDPQVWQVVRSPSVLLAMIYSGVFSTGVAYATWHAGVRAVGGSHAAVYQNVVTLVAVAGGWLWLREQPLAAQLLGGCLTIAGLLLMRRGRKTTRTASPSPPIAAITSRASPSVELVANRTWPSTPGRTSGHREATPAVCQSGGDSFD